MNQEISLKSVFKAEDARQKPFNSVEGYLKELEYTHRLIGDHILRVRDVVMGEPLNHFNSEFVKLIVGIKARGEMASWVAPQPRKEALQDFYTRSLEKFDDPKDRMIFIQCVAALDQDEELDLLDIYLDDFNAALIKYREGDERDAR